MRYCLRSHDPRRRTRHGRSSGSLKREIGDQSSQGQIMEFAALATLALPFAAAAPAAAQAAPPKLIVAISVDQFSADLFAQYRQYYTGGLRRLSEGVVFPC